MSLPRAACRRVARFPSASRLLQRRDLGSFLSCTIRLRTSSQWPAAAFRFLLWRRAFRVLFLVLAICVIHKDTENAVTQKDMTNGNHSGNASCMICVHEVARPRHVAGAGPEKQFGASLGSRVLTPRKDLVLHYGTLRLAFFTNTFPIAKHTLKVLRPNNQPSLNPSVQHFQRGHTALEGRSK